jgi:long-chain-fatty-acid--CoA ligase ACSBG
MSDNQIYDMTDQSSLFPTMTTILFAIILLTVLLVIIYYFWYADRSHLDTGEELPMELYKEDDTIVSVFEKIKDRYGSYTAFRHKVDKKYKNTSYTDYWIDTEAFSQRLLYFMGPHPRVAIMSHNRPEWFNVHMGTMMSNGVSVGIYPTLMANSCEYVINHSCADLVVVENIEQLQKLSSSKINSVKLILTLEEINDDIDNVIELVKKNNPNLDIISYHRFLDNSVFGSSPDMMEIEVSKPHLEDIATIIYTSGTTGDPKGVVQTHQSIMSAIRNCLYTIKSRSNIDIRIGERFISYLPLNHIASQLMDIYIPICSIGTVTFASSDSLRNKNIISVIREVKPTIFIGVPRVWEKMEEEIKSKLSSNDDGWFAGTVKRLMSSGKVIRTKIGLDQVKYCVSAAASLSDSTKVFFETIGIELCNVYGMSETCGPISMGVPGSSKGVGVPVIDVKIDSQTSEIMVRGDSMFKNYYKDDKATMDSYTKHRRWFKTGDIGYMDRSGTLFIIGRMKDLIITTGGENISPIPIEDAIKTEIKNYNGVDLSPFVDNVIVVGDNRKFISVLIFLSKRGIDTYADGDEMMNTMNNVIDKVNALAPNPTSTVKKILIVNEELEIGHTLTPTLKVKRSKINDMFKKDIDNLYKSI